ncbi:hypothetical protein FA95DRAFT_1566438 [Auriscalpium vulgare]|uniref:Uncharacterized protein n=1 Tax=Auriscalpium vulgare TaxID=40419 RepID=A0ACB8R8Z4_9AGAM|nr:hypothetical protein FA95DRAFT_1566438 [Auriscalpium vulgare]
MDNRPLLVGYHMQPVCLRTRQLAISNYSQPIILPAASTAGLPRPAHDHTGERTIRRTSGQNLSPETSTSYKSPRARLRPLAPLDWRLVSSEEVDVRAHRGPDDTISYPLLCGSFLGLTTSVPDAWPLLDAGPFRRSKSRARRERKFSIENGEDGDNLLAVLGKQQKLTEVGVHAARPAPRMT